MGISQVYLQFDVFQLFFKFLDWLVIGLGFRFATDFFFFLTGISSNMGLSPILLLLLLLFWKGFQP